MFADLQGAVRVRAAERVGSVDGGGGQCLRHGHPHVDAGQVHDDGLRKRRRMKVRAGRRGTLGCLRPHHGAAEGVRVEVAPEGDDHAGVQHVSGSRLRQPEEPRGHDPIMHLETGWGCYLLPENVGGRGQEDGSRLCRRHGNNAFIRHLLQVADGQRPELRPQLTHSV